MATVYRPKHQKQLNSSDPYGAFNCTSYSVAIGGDRATIGGVVVTGKDVRAASSEPVPDPASPGLNLPQATAALFRLTRINLQVRNGPWSGVPASLKAGRGLVLQGDYDQMGAFSCQSSFRLNHAIYLNNLNSGDVVIAGTTYGPGKCALTYDPLCSAFRWVPLTVLRKYAEKLGAAIGHPGKVLYATTRVTPLIEAAA